MVAFHLPVNGYLSAWTCSGHKGANATRTFCPPYVVHTKYIDRAVLEAYRKLDTGELQTLAAKRGSAAATVNAAQAALRWKTQQPRMKKVEYLFLDELVERITYAKWNECVITWKFGLVSHILVQYDKVSEIPNIELTRTDEGYMANGEKVVAGYQVMRRLEKTKTSCMKARTGGERPSAARVKAK